LRPLPLQGLFCFYQPGKDSVGNESNNFYFMKRATKVIIDKITNSIEERATGKSFETNIVLVKTDEIKSVLKKDGWFFNWKKEFKEEGRLMYKLTLEGDTGIQGLISLQVMENYIEMHLIESAPINQGSEKDYVGVPANMVAFVCKLSYEIGFDGNVGFVAKTALIQHYIDSLGAQVLMGNRMGIVDESAKKLVNSYFKDYFKDYFNGK